MELEMKADEIWNKLPKNVRDFITEERRKRAKGFKALKDALELDCLSDDAKELLQKELTVYGTVCIAYVDQDKCTGCDLCVDACKYDAIVMVGGTAWVNSSICILHSMSKCYPNFPCQGACREGAIIKLWLF